MNSFYEYETRMNQIKDNVEKTAREAWKTTEKKAQPRIHLQIVSSFLLWLNKL